MTFARNNSAAIESSGAPLGKRQQKLHPDYACDCELDEQALLAVEPGERHPIKECDCITPSEGVMQIGHC